MDLTERQLLDKIGGLPHSRASFKHLVRELGAHGEGRERLETLLDKLTARGELIETRGGHFVLARASREYASGRLSVHREGYGFLIPDKPVQGVQGDIFLPRDEAAKAMHGDRILVRIARIESDGRADGEIVKILRRAHYEVVGTFHTKRRGFFVEPFDDRIQDWIEIPEGMEIPSSGRSIDRVGVEPIRIESSEDLDGMIVNVQIVEFPVGGEGAVGRVTEVLGHPDDFGIDVEIVIRKHHIPHAFPGEVIDQARRFPSTVPAAEIVGRQDFRDYDIVTIDGETARDFDDAVWVDRLPNGNYALHVHIADVSYYVRPGSPIDQEAAFRGTSVYFPDRAVPMLPMELSTELCSLKPGVDRLVVSALLEIDHQGEMVAQDFVRGVIRSKERMTYTNVHKLLEGDQELRERYAPLVGRFELMREVALKLNRMRAKRGSIDFDLPEPIIEFDLQGEMTGIVRSIRNIAHRIIEEFMLAANEAVAGHIEAAGMPMIYRIHEPPDPKRIMDFEEVAGRFGYSLGLGALPVKRFHDVKRHRDGRKTSRQIELPGSEIAISPRAYQKLVAKLEGKPEERILTYLMLRSLKQARYSEQNRGHYALAATSYTHFTSPIRRYPDLVVHRILSEYLDRQTVSLREDELHDIAEDSSFTERRADEAERDLVEWKKARFMVDRVGEEFDALIISTTKFGFFIELDQWFMEGLVPIDSLPGDRFRYHENSRKIIGERSRREYSMGQQVRVILERVDAVEHKLTFFVIEPERHNRRKSKKSK